MNTTDIFASALNLPKPWSIAKVEFKPDSAGAMELHIEISFPKGSKFSCPECEVETTAYDTKPRSWRHLNFFQYKTYIHADLPRVKCGEHGVKTISVPWAREGSGFTLLFEGWVVELAKHLPVATIADMVNEHDTRLWRFIKHYVDEARSREDYSNVTAIGIDETSKKGHKYVTVVVDLNQRKVIYVTNGKDSTTVDNFAEDFAAHKGDAEAIKIVTCDMSLGFKKGINEHFTNSSTVIDKFHVIKHINEAVDEVRREEQRQDPWYKYLLNKTKYLWLKNDANLTGKQHERKESLLKKRLKTARAYTMRVTLQDIYELSTNRTEAEKRLKQLCNWISRSRLAPMKKFGELLKNHWEEILNYFDHRYTNAILEGMNSIIQNIKRRARGFRNDEFFKTMIYLGCGKLDLNVAK